MTESRGHDRTPIHYTMKAPHAPWPSPGPRSSHGCPAPRSSTHTKHSSRGSKPSTPNASPRMPYSVGQSYPPQPPKLSPGKAPERAPSPNYFGHVPDENVDLRESPALPRDNYSPSTSSAKPFTAALPKKVPMDANHDYEAFRRQADLNRGGDSFHHSASQPSPTAPRPSASRPQPSTRWHTHVSDMVDLTLNRSADDRTSSRMGVNRDSLHDSAYVSSDSKRNSESSLYPPSFPDVPQVESPRPTDSSHDRRTTLSKIDDRHPRLSMTQNRLDPPSPGPSEVTHQKANTAPAKADNLPSMVSTSRLKELLGSPGSDTDLLLLDLRVSQQYQQARIKQALNLCTPTTLLKRATFNLQKLQQTFQRPEDKERFSKWSTAKNLIVYDAHSIEKRDATTCLNMIKKFTNEGYKGQTFILSGGFNAFYDAYPESIDEGPAGGAGGPQSLATNQNGGRFGIPPVMGGVMLPTTSASPSPFFSNIRQNMDLADGVGQLDISRPGGLESPGLPRWLRDASKSHDRGKQVSDKFLHIEEGEQSRMQKAYSMFKPGRDPAAYSSIQLCGVEKGGKNRYKDILPFEHARVRLHSRPSDSCDYVNASHIKASGSNKRYIATQGPLPATFEDFWSMIWEQDVRVVVMLTAETEGGTLKCHPYWKGRDFGSIRLRLLSEKKVSLDMDNHRSSSQASSAEAAGRRRANTTTTVEGSNSGTTQLPGPSETPYVTIRKFALSHASFPFAPIREITHLHYPSWPDFGAPARPCHLLGVVEIANVMQRAALPIDTPSIASKAAPPEIQPTAWFDEPESDARARPMLVHCSAGCGRTGTFCTVDTVIDMLKRQRLAKTTLKPVRKRDSDGDIKMSGEREVEEPVSPAVSFSPDTDRRVSMGDRRSSRDSPLPLLDTEWVGDEMVDLIAKTVEDFRGQRLSMVQSLRQFVLCYESVLEYLTRMHERSNANMTATGRARSETLQLPWKG